jgi:hypothetical protein
MKTNADNLVEVPCFKCLFWNPIKESHLHCNPNECPQMTEWLVLQAEPEQVQKGLTVVSVIPENRAKKAMIESP